MKIITRCSCLVVLLISLMACEDDSPPALQPLETTVGEAFVIKAPSSVRLTGLENTELNIDITQLDKWIARGLYSRRTLVHLKLSNEQHIEYTIEAGYDKEGDMCYGHEGTVCDSVAFSAGGEQFLLQVEEVYWSEQQLSDAGVEYYSVDSAKFIVKRL